MPPDRHPAGRRRLGHGVPGRARAGRAGLVLTNAHVAEGLGVGTVTFGHEGRRGGVAATGVRLVARSAALDYALVRVALPAGTRLPVLPLAGGDAGLPERVYSSGFDDLAALAGDADLGNFDWSQKDRRELSALRGRVRRSRPAACCSAAPSG